MVTTSNKCEHPSGSDTLNYHKPVEYTAPTEPFDGYKMYYYYSPYTSKFYSSTLKADKGGYLSKV